MSNYIGNIPEGKKDTKRIAAAILLICAILLVIGMVAAFFSHVIEESVDFNTGTLKIKGTYTYQINGTQTQLDNIRNLNPGDSIIINGTVMSEGNSSAWIRDVISFASADSELLPYLKVYLGEFSQEDLITQDLSEYALQMNDGQFATANKVINGYGDGAETEDGGDYEHLENVTFLNASSYQISFTIYFLPTATNDTQGKEFSLTVGAQALQFKNNNSAQPDESVWSALKFTG